MFLMAILMVKAVLALRVPRFGGFTNFDEGILAVEGITPIGAGLHDPVLICRPFVMGTVTFKQKLMKLLELVSDATWPGAGTCCPSWAKPVAMTLGSRAEEVTIRTRSVENQQYDTH